MSDVIKKLRDISSGRNGHFQGKIKRSTNLRKVKGNRKGKKGEMEYDKEKRERDTEKEIFHGS